MILHRQTERRLDRARKELQREQQHPKGDDGLRKPQWRVARGRDLTAHEGEINYLPGPWSRQKGKQGFYYRSNDAGVSWVVSAKANGSVREIQFLNAEHGWVLGDRDVLSTTDGGATWRTAAVDRAALGS